MTNAIISLKNVNKTIGGKQLLVDITFDIREQSLVSLIGPNGAGKTTLVKIILGLDPHYTGTVHIRKNTQIQYIPQLSATDQYQLPLSVYEYLRIGTTPLYSQRKSFTATDYEEALTHVGVSLGTLHQSYLGLSGGERQRVAIARALLSNPNILVLDEPLAAVDYVSRGGLYELIRHLQQDHHMTVLLVSHDIESVLPLSDRVLCLNKTLRTDCHQTTLSPIEEPPQVIHHHCSSSNPPKPRNSLH
ncbi:MAG: metal ABC transporter ATP-binding protein [Candidatus Nomurabacteria bacterium]|nr:MAG: metal ABC transporter ATP-binding protein [Candidatus Nomurabacteria bacterium]